MDEPPPLEDCSGILNHLHSSRQKTEKTISKTSSPSGKKIKKIEDKISLLNVGDDKTQFANIIQPISGEGIIPQESKPLRRGFLNTGVKDNSSGPKSRKSIPLIKAKQSIQKVPDLLKPTEELVNEVMQNNVIKSGLEDPEIMKAVQEIATNPSAMEKHKRNPKVAAFYSGLGKFMEDELEKKLQ